MANNDQRNVILKLVAGFTVMGTSVCSVSIFQWNVLDPETPEQTQRIEMSPEYAAELRRLRDDIAVLQPKNVSPTERDIDAAEEKQAPKQADRTSNQRAEVETPVASTQAIPNAEVSPVKQSTVLPEQSWEFHGVYIHARGEWPMRYAKGLVEELDTNFELNDNIEKAFQVMIPAEPIPEKLKTNTGDSLTVHAPFFSATAYGKYSAMNLTIQFTTYLQNLRNGQIPKEGLKSFANAEKERQRRLENANTQRENE